MSGALKVTTPSGLIGENSICMFKGILIFMQNTDASLKNTPHFYAQYEGEYAVFSLPDAQMIQGNLPKNMVVLIEAWIELRRDELMANWAILQEGELPYRIPPIG